MRAGTDDFPQWKLHNLFTNYPFTNRDSCTMITALALKVIFKSLIDKYSKEYDYIVVDSDEDGTLAAFCRYAAIIADKETYDEDELNNRVIQLEDKECNVLGVIIRE